MVEVLVAIVTAVVVAIIVVLAVVWFSESLKNVYSTLTGDIKTLPLENRRFHLSQTN